MSLQPSFHGFHVPFGQGDSFFVDIAAQTYDGLDSFPSHGFCPFKISGIFIHHAKRGVFLLASHVVVVVVVVGFVIASCSTATR